MSEITVPRRAFLQGCAMLSGVLAAGSVGGWGLNNLARKLASNDPKTDSLASSTGELYEALKKQIYEYKPPFEAQRKTVELRDFPLIRARRADDFIENLPKELELIINLIDQKVDDPIINPNLSDLPWFVIAGDLDYFRPPTLRQILSRLYTDMSGGFLEVNTQAIQTDTFAYLSDTTYGLNNGLPQLKKTVITFNADAIETNLYPSLENKSVKLPISNLQLLIVLLYEYGHRLSNIQDIVLLQKTGFFQRFPSQSPDDAKATIEEFREINWKTGYRYSFAQNQLIMEFQRAIAALAGDPNGKVVGLERNESLDI